jgi:hypothetical protein
VVSSLSGIRISEGFTWPCLSVLKARVTMVWISGRLSAAHWIRHSSIRPLAYAAGPLTTVARAKR